MREHLDIFSGIGGFALAAQWAGFRTIAFCESDSRCREFLGKQWGLPVHPDIRKLNAAIYRGVSLLTGGPPCQPSSRAGKQAGATDDRWLWPEALRVLDEAKPLAVVFENPLGIGDLAEFGILPPMDGNGNAVGDIGDTFHHDGYGVLDKIMDDIESFGYEAQAFDIPACSVDSPQIRHRYWIVAFKLGESDSNGREQRRPTAKGARYRDSIDSTVSVGLANASSAGHKERGMQRGIRSRAERADEGQTVDMDAQSLVADTECERRERRSAEPSKTEGRQPFSSVTGLHWQNSVWVPCADGKLRRAPDDSFLLVDGLHRSLLGALGNAIVPQVAFEILKAVKSVLK